MVIASAPFAAFVLVVLGLYFLLPRRGQVGLLLVASYALYASWSWHFPLGLLALTLANYWIARRLWAGAGRPWLWAGIASNVLALVLLKYAGFYLPTALRVLGLAPGDDLARLVQILLPAGFSYRVLENISFLIDASRRQVGEFPSFPSFALFVSYFPKLLSGPIERGRAFLGQLSAGRAVDNEAVTRGVTLIVVGLVRKFVIADTIRALIPGGLFTAPLDREGFQLFFWVIADVFVIYNDFAGYTDIVRGTSALFGIDLTRNFSVPFFSRNFSELWLRWHTSLSLWLRDYVYMPLSRAILRRSDRPSTPAALIVPPLAAMLVSALWHQVAWNMLAWGLLWGVFLFAGRIQTLWRPATPPDRQPGWRQALGMLRVVGLLAVSNMLFEMDLPQAWTYFQNMLAPLRWTKALSSAYLLVLVSLAVDWVQHRSGDETVFARWPLWIRSVALAVALAALFLATRLEVPEPFIYQNF